MTKLLYFDKISYLFLAQPLSLNETSTLPKLNLYLLTKLSTSWLKLYFLIETLYFLIKFLPFNKTFVLTAISTYQPIYIYIYIYSFAFKYVDIIVRVYHLPLELFRVLCIYLFVRLNLSFIILIFLNTFKLKHN